MTTEIENFTRWAIEDEAHADVLANLAHEFLASDRTGAEAALDDARAVAVHAGANALRDRASVRRAAARQAESQLRLL